MRYDLEEPEMPVENVGTMGILFGRGGSGRNVGGVISRGVVGIHCAFGRREGLQVCHGFDRDGCARFEVGEWGERVVRCLVGFGKCGCRVWW